MANPLRIKRGTRAQINVAKAANGLAAGEPYLVTDEGRVDVGTAANASVSLATKAEVDAKAPLNGAGTSGTWPISITGNAASASAVSWAGVTGKPTEVTNLATELAARNVQAINRGVAAYVNYTDTPAVGMLTRIRLPWLAGGGVMVSFEIASYGTYIDYVLRVSGYLYSAINQWHAPKVILVAQSGWDSGVPVVMGRDENGYAYVAVPATNYQGISIQNVVIGYVSTDVPSTGWVFSRNSATPNIALSQTALPSSRIDHSHTWGAITGKPAVIAAGADAATARTAIGAGTSNLALGTTAGTALAGNTAFQVPLVSGSNIKTINGSSLLGSGDLTISPNLLRSARSSNTQLVAADKGKLIDITSGTFTQTFAACSALGDGWWCYLGNSGTGDITLDPDASEQIDGLASYVMYPGEMRLVQCDGTTLRSVVVQSFSKTFTASGTFTKPPGYALFDSLTWSGGNSGRKETGPGTNAPGGGGGGCFPARIPAALLGATTTITVGAGGAARTTASDGALGGESSIGTLVVVGQSATYSNGGAVKLGTAPLASSGSTADGFGYASGGAGNAVWGGGAAIQTATAYGSIYGGAGGGGYVGGSIRAPGSSVLGGAGGTGALMGNATDGTAPGGGGGGAYNGNSGAGARGEVRIWGVL